NGMADFFKALGNRLGDIGHVFHDKNAQIVPPKRESGMCQLPQVQSRWEFCQRYGVAQKRRRIGRKYDFASVL
ncbi:hypothetical protein, partial [Klebsiella pneumoniae]|uniref:hypothetical protein n=1 Tax=Klebsiella pneumoniae TaxID=573 RepID=UPI0019545FB1